MITKKEDIPKRKRLPHEVPWWVADQSTFFITVCCKRRGPDQLCGRGIADALLESVEFYGQLGKWWCHLFLVMPDHVHGLFVFPRGDSMRRCIASWKSYHARVHKICWQDGFFDHRIRNGDALQEKAAYIRSNPVRANLVHSQKDWPHVFVGKTDPN